MRTIALLAQKGGSGKTQLTTNIAVAAALTGLKVAIVDTDKQATASYWGEIRENSKNPLEVPVIGVLAGSIQRELRKLKEQGFEFIVIDTPGKEADTSTPITKASDFVIIPAKPTTTDIHAIASTLDIVDNANVPGMIVFNEAYVRGPRNDTAAAYIVNELEFPVAPEYICDRVTFQDAFSAGQGVMEFEAGSEAATEIASLYNHLIENLNRLDKATKVTAAG